MSTKKCPKCNKEHNNKGIYCSRSCANSRGPRTEEFKLKVSNKLKGKNFHTTESLVKGIVSKGKTPHFIKENQKCVICEKETPSWKRKTCSKQCYSTLMKINSQQNSNCGGQKHTHRVKILNLKNEVFVAESSFEVRLANILNELGIYWKRPSYFWYTDDQGNKRRYYPDFFIPSCNVYLDPKNSYLIKTDINKIIKCANENDIKIIVLGEKYLSLDMIEKVVGNDGTAPPYPACKTGALLLS
jgi:hypothetical protein